MVVRQTCRIEKRLGQMPSLVYQKGMAACRRGRSTEGQDAKYALRHSGAPQCDFGVDLSVQRAAESCSMRAGLEVPRV